MRRPAVLAIMCLLAALTGGCASPPARFYTLSPVPMPASAATQVCVAVGPVSVPAAVDRPQIVVTTSANQVEINEWNRWASPLQDSLARVIADELSATLQTPCVTVFQNSPQTKVDYRVEIEVRNFESALGKEAAVEAVWTVYRMNDGKSRFGRTAARETVHEPGFDAVAAAHSRAVGRVSEDIAAAVQTFDRAMP